jgi:hypothetical protein
MGKRYIALGTDVEGAKIVIGARDDLVIARVKTGAIVIQKVKISVTFRIVEKCQVAHVVLRQALRPVERDFPRIKRAVGNTGAVVNLAGDLPRDQLDGASNVSRPQLQGREAAINFDALKIVQGQVTQIDEPGVGLIEAHVIQKNVDLIRRRSPDGYGRERTESPKSAHLDADAFGEEIGHRIHPRRGCIGVHHGGKGRRVSHDGRTVEALVSNFERRQLQGLGKHQMGGEKHPIEQKKTNLIRLGI